MGRKGLRVCFLGLKKGVLRRDIQVALAIEKELCTIILQGINN